MCRCIGSATLSCCSSYNICDGGYRAVQMQLVCTHELVGQQLLQRSAQPFLHLGCRYLTFTSADGWQLRPDHRV